MENLKATGGPAYPVKTRISVPGINPSDGSDYHVGIEHQFDGMTLLDHFAGLAMQGWLATFVERDMVFPVGENAKHLVMCSYKIAGEMIAERERIMTEKP